MEPLEIQVGQIYINNRRLSKSFVSLFSEKVPESGAEIFILLEIIAVAPGTWIEYEKIAKQIASNLKKYYKKSNQNSFENAIATINDQLASVAGEGQTNWIGKINACLAVRENNSLSIATTGKIHAYLFRDKQFSDIADSSSNKNPLKTFENFVVGRIGKKDILLFTTAQLLNYISLEKLKKILADLSIKDACQNVAQVIKESAEENVSFGTFILELGSGLSNTESGGLEIVENLQAQTLKQKALSIFAATSRLTERGIKAGKEINLPKLDFNKINPQNLKAQAKRYTDIDKFRSLPKNKRFFLIAATIFILLLIINIAIAVRIHFTHSSSQAITQKLDDVQNKINSANAGFIYNDHAQALNLAEQASIELATIPSSPTNDISKSKLQKEITALIDLANNVHQVTPKEVITYSGGLVDRMAIIGNTLYLINLKGQSFIPYNLSSKSLNSSFLLNTPSLKDMATNSNSLVVEDTAGKIYSVDLKKQNFNQLPAAFFTNTIGLKLGSNRIYALNLKDNQIISAPLNQNVVSKTSLNLSGVINFDADPNNVFLLLKDQVTKFSSTGQNKPFTNSSGASFNAASKIYLYNNLYLLNNDNNRLIVSDRNGNNINEYASDKFTNLKDLIVDEAHKTAYLLNDNTVYSIPIQ